MKAAFSERFIRQYSGVSAERRAKFDKQLRVDADYRFYFQIVGDTYRILFIRPHPK